MVVTYVKTILPVQEKVIDLIICCSFIAYHILCIGTATTIISCWHFAFILFKVLSSYKFVTIAIPTYIFLLSKCVSASADETFYK